MLQKILDKKIIAIIRGVLPQDMTALAQALLDGGVSMMEVTFDQSSQTGISQTLESLALLNRVFMGRIGLGAGTVLTVDQVEQAERAGAHYIISPNTDIAVIARTKELGLVSIPGAATPSEIVTAHAAGADIVKLFPVGIWGIEYIKAIRAPLSHIPMAAVGGVSIDNIADFLAAGVQCVGVGGSLVSPERVKAGEFDAIRRDAAALNERISPR